MNVKKCDFCKKELKNNQHVHSTKYQEAYLRLMQRTDDNAELNNALNSFLDILNQHSFYGDISMGMNPNKLTKFLKEVIEKAKQDKI